MTGSTIRKSLVPSLHPFNTVAPLKATTAVRRPILLSSYDQSQEAKVIFTGRTMADPYFRGVHHVMTD